MHRTKGFTIVEFAIAIAVATILGAVAISRYNSYLRVQEFANGGSAIASCLQRGSVVARTGSPTDPMRFVRTTITSDTPSATVKCQVESFPATVNGAAVTVSQLLQGIPAEGATSQVFTAESTVLHTGSNVRVVFGSIEGGVGLGFSRNSALVVQPTLDSAPAGAGLRYGAGFVINENTNSIRLNSEGTNDLMCGVVVMPASGSPVSFRQLASCS
jgi:Tfp pilus assembly major pilin PilA